MARTAAPQAPVPVLRGSGDRFPPPPPPPSVALRRQAAATAARRRDPAAEPPFTCRACGTTNPPQLQSCIGCATPKPSTLSISQQMLAGQTPGSQGSSPMWAAPHQTSGLAHCSWWCPGLHGKGACRQDIRRRSFADLLGGRQALRIPPFQRRYCWPERLAASWWRDCLKVQGGGTHSTGKAVFSPAANGGELLVIDGQQRLTTACLCLAALRDAALRELSQIGDACDAGAAAALRAAAARADSLLFRDAAAAAAWRAAAPERAARGEQLYPEGVVPPFVALAPSFVDRAPFAAMLLGGPEAGGAGDDSRPAVRAKMWFDAAAAAYCLREGGGPGGAARALHAVLRGLTDGMSVMAIELIDPPRETVQQVYLWFQEKSVCGEGAMLLNPCPGISMAWSDLARNMILAPLLSEGAARQDAALRDHWVPLEQRFSGPRELDAFLSRFVAAHPAPPAPGAATVLAAAGMAERAGVSGAGALRAYAEFISTYDAVLAGGGLGGAVAPALAARMRPDGADGAAAAAAYDASLFAVAELTRFADAEEGGAAQPGSPMAVDAPPAAAP